MTRDETKKIIKIISDSYPSFKPEDISGTINTWCAMLNEYSYEQIAKALKAYILSNESGFAPCIGQLVSLVHKSTKEKELDAMEAWALVKKALSNSAYESLEEFAKLPKLVQKAVGLPIQLQSWAVSDDFNENVIMSHFVSAYKVTVESQKEFEKMSSEMQQMIEDANRNSYFAYMEQKRQNAINCASEEKQRLISENNSITVSVEMPARLQEEINEQKKEWCETWT